MASSFKEILAQVKAQIREVSPAEVHEMLRNGKRILLLDVREPDEVAQGYVQGALHLPRGFLEVQIERKVPDRSTSIVTYCAGGARSALAAKALQELGYTDVVSMAGGFTQWANLNLPVVKPAQEADSRKIRYSRHITIPEVGEEGQQRLLNAKVLMVGAGGLGSGSALYLGAAGVGTLGIVDNDVVELSNLQRQVLHTMNFLGRPKTESAMHAIRGINPETKVVPYSFRLTRENIAGIVKDYDIILDGADNFPTRYLINDAAVFSRKPVVHGSIFRFEGQVTTIIPYEGPCYRCLYPEPPPPDLAPS